MKRAGGPVRNIGRARAAGALAVLAVVTLVTLAGCDLLSSLSSPSFSPVVDDLRDGADLIVAGDFTTVNGASRQGLVRIDHDGRVDPDFAVTSDGYVVTVEPVVRDGRTLVLVGGSFTQINGVARSGIAALDATTGAVVTGFAPVLGPLGANDTQVSAILPVPGRDSVIIGGVFQGAASDPATGALDVSVTSLVEVRWADGGAVATFSPALQPISSGDLFVDSIAPGLDELGAWSVVVVGQFLAANHPTYGAVHAAAALDATGAVRAIAEPTSVETSRLRAVVTDRERGVYRVAGDMLTGAVPIHYAEVYFIDVTTLNDFQPEPGTPFVETSTLTTVLDAARLPGGRLLVAGPESMYALAAAPGGLAAATIVDEFGVPSTTAYLSVGTTTYPNSFVWRVTAASDGYYLAGTFEHLIDPLGGTSGSTLARVDGAGVVDTAFSVAFSGPRANTNPFAFDVVELPPGF